jgi:hypothetical protein
MKYIVLLMLFVSSCTNPDRAKMNATISKEIENPFALSNDATILKLRYGDNLLLRAIDHVVYDNDISDYFSYDDSIRTLVKDRPLIVDSLLCIVQQEDSASGFLKNIGAWCDTYVTISACMSIDDFFSTEEVLCEIPCTKEIVQSYLNSPLQDWGSLSEEQIYSLPHKICDLMCTIPDKDRIAFYATFYEKVGAKLQEHSGGSDLNKISYAQ